MGPIYFSNVQCTGMETNILSCTSRSQLMTTTCDHTQDAAVRCESKGGAYVRGKALTKEGEMRTYGTKNRCISVPSLRHTPLR